MTHVIIVSVVEMRREKETSVDNWLYRIELLKRRNKNITKKDSYKIFYMKKNKVYRMISMLNLSASSLYLFLIVTSVTPATSDTSRCVLRSPHNIDAT